MSIIIKCPIMGSQEEEVVAQVAPISSKKVKEEPKIEVQDEGVTNGNV